MEPVLHGARTIPTPLEGSVVTLGAFDGVHRGHQTLIRRAVEAARPDRVPAVGFTFHPHPAKVLAPARAPSSLMALVERTDAMRGYGLDHVVVEPFDEAFSRVTADEFVARYLVEPLRPRRVVVGFNFAYGHRRGGDLDHLRAAGARFGFEVDVVEPVEADGAVCSSTEIRARLRDGDLPGAEALLGRRHVLTGEVVKGDQRGRTLGFPTANVDPEAELLPKAGVYATRVQIGAQPTWLPSVTNIGQRPTFGGGHVTVEAFLLDFSRDLYGQRLRVELVARLRDERRFDGLEALKGQLDADVAAARAALGA